MRHCSTLKCAYVADISEILPCRRQIRPNNAAKISVHWFSYINYLKTDRRTKRRLGRIRKYLCYCVNTKTF